METPRFRPHLMPAIVRPDQLYLLSEQGAFLLRGRSVACVAELLDGNRKVEEIIAAADGVSEGQVRYVLAHLESRGYTCDAYPALDEGSAAYWSSLGLAPGEAASRLADLRLSVTSLGSCDGEPLRAALEEMGLALGEGGTRIVLCDDYLHPDLEEINRGALASAERWMLCRPVGLDLLVGPVFVPGKTGCWRCLQQRLAANRSIEDYLARSNQQRASSRPATLPSVARLAAGLIATEISRWLVTGRTGLEGEILSVSTVDWGQRRHQLTRRPQCAACGDPDLLRQPRPIRLASCSKVHTHDGGHRAASPAATLRRLEHHISPITGVVHTLERITPEEDDLQHVFVSGQNMALQQGSYHQLRRNLRSRSCGKGVSEDQARVSAVCEAIERYSGVFRGTEPVRNGSLVELGSEAIDPRACMLFSAEQYRDRQAINARGSFFNRVPQPFDVEAKIDWSPVWSLTHEEHRYLPTPLLYYSYPDNGMPTCLPDSNGCAAGNTREEAILQGLLELVERDAVASWWYNRIAMPEVDLDSVDHPYVQRLRRRHAETGRHLWVLDLRGDLGVPVFVALSRRIDRSPRDIVFAPAAHHDPQVALLRALTELNQMMPAVSNGSEPGEYAYDDEECIRWWRTATLDNQPYLAPTQAPRTDLRTLDWQASDDIRDDIALLKGRVEAQGLELLVLDQTRPDIDLAVVKVIVPGLRHFWARFAPGRLYDVPVAMGWRDEPLAESDLNPISIFI